MSIERRMSLVGVLLCLIVPVAVAACGGDDDGAGGDDDDDDDNGAFDSGAEVADGGGESPDAAPEAPDADLGAPDDAPGAQDGAPGIDAAPLCDVSDTFDCDGLDCTLAQICYISPTLGGACYDVPDDEQCLPCSTQFGAAPDCPRLYFPSLSGSPETGCTVTCE
jgi:hypothetical protein